MWRPRNADMGSDASSAANSRACVIENPLRTAIAVDSATSASCFSSSWLTFPAFLRSRMYGIAPAAVPAANPSGPMSCNPVSADPSPTPTARSLVRVRAGKLRGERRAGGPLSSAGIGDCSPERRSSTATVMSRSTRPRISPSRPHSMAAAINAQLIMIASLIPARTSLDQCPELTDRPRPPANALADRFRRRGWSLAGPACRHSASWTRALRQRLFDCPRARGEHSRVDPFIPIFEQLHHGRHPPRGLECPPGPATPGKDVLEDDRAGSEPLHCRDPRDHPAAFGGATRVHDQVERPRDLLADMRNGQFDVGHE